MRKKSLRTRLYAGVFSSQPFRTKPVPTSKFPARLKNAFEPGCQIAWDVDGISRRRSREIPCARDLLAPPMKYPFAHGTSMIPSRMGYPFAHGISLLTWDQNWPITRNINFFQKILERYWINFGIVNPAKILENFRKNVFDKFCQTSLFLWSVIASSTARIGTSLVRSSRRS